MFIWNLVPRFFAIMLILGTISLPSFAYAQWYNFGNGMINLALMARIDGYFSIHVAPQGYNCGGLLSREIDTINNNIINEQNINDAIARINALPNCMWHSSGRVEFSTDIARADRFTLTLFSSSEALRGQARISDLRHFVSVYNEIGRIVGAQPANR